MLIHWHMRNPACGFEHLEHRYRVPGGKDASVIPVEQRPDLNDLLAERHGIEYATHPRLKSLMTSSGGIHRHFLGGEEEVQAFREKEFIRMHNSTLYKTELLHPAIRKFPKGNLRTSSRGSGVALDRIFEDRLAKSMVMMRRQAGRGKIRP